ncbi:MAG: HD domain-containing protein [Spirochaetaceae bacterium]|nr:MAG: HD domain-containing protein [Spirochaetaceae bacterium]
MTSSEQKLREILALDVELNRIQDVDILLERILSEARRVARADAGSIYVRKEDELLISYAQNDTHQAKLPTGQKLIYNVFTVPISHKTISGYCAATGEQVNIPDVYEIPEEAPYGFDPSYDRISEYRSRSMLAVPLRDQNGSILGVIQLINKMNPDGSVGVFDADDELITMHFATNATVALQRAQMTRAIILRMIRMAELRDPKETGPHVNRVAGYSVEIYERWAQRQGRDPNEIERARDNLRMAAMLHDVGKVAISDTILKKPGRFTDEEFSVMKTHTWVGARLFADRQSEFDDIAAEIAVSHHESWDGTGYPGKVDIDTGTPVETDDAGKALGYAGEEIPIYGRIVSIADVYDALCSSRVYKEAWSEEDVIEEIRKLSGVKFDPEVVECFLEVLPNIRQITKRYKDPE